MNWPIWQPDPPHNPPQSEGSLYDSLTNVELFGNFFGAVVEGVVLVDGPFKEI